MAFGYPISLELAGRRAVVIGEEAVAQGKVDGLLAAGASVLVVAEGPEWALDALPSGAPGGAVVEVTVERRAYRPGDLRGAFVCVASSSDPDERAAIHAEARERGVLVNVMDDVQHCDFAAPAVVRRGDLVLAISTGGRSQALAKRLKADLGRQFGPEWSSLLDLLGEVRDRTLPVLPDLRERARRWQRALDPGELLGLLREGRREEARRRLLEWLLGDPGAGDGEGAAVREAAT